jgi:isoleucyl-tRNA synthetase
VHNFCTIDLSAIYLDILKDRLYTSLPGAVERRAAQTAMYDILVTLVAMLSPVLSFTTEEAWQHMPKTEGMPESVQMVLWPEARPECLDAALEAKWDKILALRGEITKALENARRAKTIGHSLDAAVTLWADGDDYRQLLAVKDDLATILIVSQAAVAEGTAKAPADAYRAEELALAVGVAPAKGAKCERCWMYSEQTGADAAHAALCPRCAAAVKKL